MSLTAKTVTLVANTASIDFYAAGASQVGEGSRGVRVTNVTGTGVVWVGLGSSAPTVAGDNARPVVTYRDFTPSELRSNLWLISTATQQVTVERLQ